MRHYTSMAVFGLAFGIATAVTLLLFASAASTLRVVPTVGAVHAVRPAPPDDDVVVVNSWDDPPGWHRHWHQRMTSLEARIRERVARQLEAAFANLPDDVDIDIDDDDVDIAPATPPVTAVPTPPVVTVRPR